jgi:hypothetical protein
MMSLEDKVVDVMEDFCDNYQSFTSLDVSNKVKQDGFPGSRHREVAEIIREKYSNGLMDTWDYSRALIDVELLNGLRTKAYLYHHNTVSPDTYMDRSQVAIVPTQQVTTQDVQDALSYVADAQDDQADAQDTQPVAQTVTVPDGDEEKRSNKADGRLEMPAAWVRHLGWRAGDTIYVIVEGGDEDALTLCQSSAVTADDTSLVTTKITPDGRLRVPKTAFMKANYPCNGDYVVSLESNAIKVREDEDAVPAPALSTPTATFCF